MWNREGKRRERRLMTGVKVVFVKEMEVEEE